jgi:dTMP kinase
MIHLISFEGGDGSGKTTQIKLLENYFATRGKLCVSTREPGGTTLGRMIRQVLLEVGHEELSSPTELFLYLADRAQHVQEVIEPAIKSGKLVLCDRFTDSTLAYQGYGRGVDLEMLRRLNQIASRGITPDLTFLLDCPADVGLSRTARRVSGQKSSRGREDRFEREKLEFHERVRNGFLELAQAEPKRIYRLDAACPIQEVHEQIKRIVDQRMSG